MFKHLNEFQRVQYVWIRNHPIQWIALNVILLGLFFGYVTYKERKALHEFEQQKTQ